MPEVAHSYAEYMEHNHDHDELNSMTYKEGRLRHGDDPDYFPLPFALAFLGYSFILLIDKVVFDTHSLIGEHHHGHANDPVEQRFIENAKSSFSRYKKTTSGEINGPKHDPDMP